MGVSNRCGCRHMILQTPARGAARAARGQRAGAPPRVRERGSAPKGGRHSCLPPYDMMFDSGGPLQLLTLRPYNDRLYDIC